MVEGREAMIQALRSCSSLISMAYHRSTIDCMFPANADLHLLTHHRLADQLARATAVQVILPDLFQGDAVPMAMAEGPQLNLTEWRARHPTFQTDQVIEQTINYMKSQLGVTRIGAVGYCLGGKHVPRFMASGKGIDLGFIAHPANLTTDEIRAIAGPISIAAGGMSFYPRSR